MTAYADRIETVHSPADATAERYARAAAITTAIGGTWVLGRDVLPYDAACPFLSITGVPCPFCGMTRLADHLVAGDVIAVVTSDPGGLVVLAVLGVLALAGLASMLGRPPVRRLPVTPLLAVAGVALAVHWVTTLLGGGFVTA